MTRDRDRRDQAGFLAYTRQRTWFMQECNEPSVRNFSARLHVFIKEGSLPFFRYFACRGARTLPAVIQELSMLFLGREG